MFIFEKKVFTTSTTIFVRITTTIAPTSTIRLSPPITLAATTEVSNILFNNCFSVILIPVGIAIIIVVVIK